MKMKNALIVLILTGLILLSGCTSGGGSGGAPSVSISNFEPMTIGTQSNPVRNGKSVTLAAMFKNEGGAAVPESPAQIVGLDGSWTGERKQPFALPIGREVRKKWTLTAPSTSGFEFDITYPVEVRYSFNYGTALRASFSWIGSGTYDTLMESADKQFIDEQLKSKGLTVEQSSIGPISIDLQTIEIIKDDKTGSLPEVSLKIENKGNGHLTANEMTIELNGIDCSPDIIGGKIQLMDKTFDAYCKVQVGADETIPRDIVIKVRYNYYVSQKTNIYYHDSGK